MSINGAWNWAHWQIVLCNRIQNLYSTNVCLVICSHSMQQPADMCISNFDNNYRSTRICSCISHVSDLIRTNNQSNELWAEWNQSSTYQEIIRVKFNIKGQDRSLIRDHELLRCRSNGSVVDGSFWPQSSRRCCGTRILPKLIVNGLISRCHAICSPPHGFFRFKGGTQNMTRCGWWVIAISSTWPNQRGLLRWMRCGKIFSDVIPNTGFFIYVLLIRSLRPILSIICKHWQSNNSEPRHSSTRKLHISQPHNRTELIAIPYTWSFKFNIISSRDHKCFIPAYSAWALHIRVHLP